MFSCNAVDMEIILCLSPNTFLLPEDITVRTSYVSSQSGGGWGRGGEAEVSTIC
jgi:hypothetical protein